MNDKIDYSRCMTRKCEHCKNKDKCFKKESRGDNNVRESK